MADAAGDEGQGPPLHRLRAQAVRSCLASTRARISAPCWLLHAVSGGFPTEFSSSSCSKRPPVCSGDILGFIYLLRGDLDPGRDIGGPNLGNAEPRSPHFCCDKLLLVSKCSNCAFITLAGSV